MHWKKQIHKIIPAILGVILLFLTNLSAQDSDTLKIKDVSKVMQQIFEQHVDKKEISTSILSHSFKYYIDQFDPERVYLLKSEVDPFLYPSTTELNEDVMEYQEGDYSVYEKLTALFTKAIDRARRWRSEFELNSSAILNYEDSEREPQRYGTFAYSGPELKKRMFFHFLRYLQEEENRFGKTAVMNKRVGIFAKYENGMRYHENEYLYQNKQGKALSPDEKEHYFALHILKALAKSLDSHTAFFNDEEAYDMKVRLEKGYEGVGLEFREGLGGAEVAGLVPGGSAEKSGLIHTGDLVVAINGKSITDEPFEKVMQMIHGKVGTFATFTVVRKEPSGKEEQVLVKLKREEIILEADRVKVRSEPFGNGIIGEITLNSFYQSPNGINSEQDIKNAILELKKKGNLRGLILDLRENGGGFLTQAVKVAGLFITNGVVVVAKFSDGEKRYYRDIEGSLAYDGPLVILTSRLTASAAEIVAQALQDYGVAIIVGDLHTYGKGSIQSQTVTGGSNTPSFKVTIGEYYTVSGKTPQIRGVRSDIVVPSPFSDEDIGEEHLEYALKSTSNIEPSYQDSLKDIQSSARKWYLKYYIPTIQHKELVWQSMIPILKKNSSYRLNRNKNFQLFLKKMGMPYELPEAENEEELADNSKNENFGLDDLQMNEAANIVKDMVLLHSKYDENVISKQEKDRTLEKVH